MKNIAVFQNDLGVGGIQKSLVNLLNNIDYQQFHVDLYLSQREEFWDVSFPEQLNVYYLKPTPGRYRFMPFNMAMKGLSYDFAPDMEYDLAIDFNSYQCSCAVAALTVPAKYRVMWIHNDVEIKYKNEWKYRVLWNFFKGKLRHYDEFVAVSAALIEPFKRLSGLSDKPFSVVQNFIDVSDIRKKAEQIPDDVLIDDSCMNFVALGRLCHQKGYDIMLDIFSKVCAARDDARLYIIGDGPDRQALEQQRDSLGLKDKVCFLGNKSNPYAYMNLMDAFVSTSRYEGQPLNIMEAMAVGLPLYCSKNLEKYTVGLNGCEDMVSALTGAQRTAKQPDDLSTYNNEILNRIGELAAKGKS